MNNEQKHFREAGLMQTRRQLFGRAALGLGTAAMAGLLTRLVGSGSSGSERDGDSRSLRLLRP